MLGRLLHHCRIAEARKESYRFQHRCRASAFPKWPCIFRFRRAAQSSPNGWRPDETGLVARHDGTMFLFHSALVALPRHELGLVVLANLESAGGVDDEIANEALKVAIEAKIDAVPVSI